MRRLRAIQSAAVAALAVAAAVSLPALASAQSGVNPDASVLPIVIENSILPINIRDAVLPLEDVQTRGTRTRVTLAADVLFAFNQATLTPVARRTVARIAGRLRDSRGVVQVDGYTDSVGADAYNLRLSQRRARAVVAALRSSAGAGKRFSARGHGESSPVAPNSNGAKDNPAGRAKNRRVTISYAKG
jgi:outer membrane protein OmpA-like peptidoglycan-associated protein